MVAHSDRAQKSALRETIESVAIAAIIAAVIRLFVLAPYWIPSASMEPTLKIDDHVLVNKLVYVFSTPKYGDIIVFHPPMDPKQNWIKRVIATGGQTVALRSGQLYINGELTPEPFLPSGLSFADFGPVTVPQGDYFVMGDNRNNSDDSRYWGPLPGRDIVGKAFMIFWPIDRIRFFRY